MDLKRNWRSTTFIWIRRGTNAKTAIVVSVIKIRFSWNAEYL